MALQDLDAGAYHGQPISVRLGLLRGSYQLAQHLRFGVPAERTHAPLKVRRIPTGQRPVPGQPRPDLSGGGDRAADSHRRIHIVGQQQMPRRHLQGSREAEEVVDRCFPGALLGSSNGHPIQREPNQRAAETLSGDLLPWEHQPGETDAAYQAFKAWLDSDKRRVTEHGVSAKNWSSQWQWSHRAREFDVYMARIDLEEQTRYRRKMNARHRQLGAVAQGKMVAWLNSLDEVRIQAMSPADATRLLDIAVKIEREATPAVDLDDLPDWAYAEASRRDGGLKQRLIDAGLNVPLSDVALLLHKMLGPAAVEPSPPPPPRPAPPQAPVEPPPTDIGSGIDIWGDGYRPKYGGLA